MARLLSASRHSAIKGSPQQEVIRTSSTPQDMVTADTVLLLLTQPEVELLMANPPTGNRMLKKRELGKAPNQPPKAPLTYVATMNLSSLCPFIENGIWYTQGRFDEQLGKILGPTKLPILPPTSRLALPFMEH